MRHVVKAVSEIILWYISLVVVAYIFMHSNTPHDEIIKVMSGWFVDHNTIGLFFMYITMAILMVVDFITSSPLHTITFFLILFYIYKEQIYPQMDIS